MYLNQEPDVILKVRLSGCVKWVLQSQIKKKKMYTCSHVPEPGTRRWGRPCRGCRTWWWWLLASERPLVNTNSPFSDFTMDNHVLVQMDNHVLVQTTPVEPNSHRTDSSPGPTMFYIKHYWNQTHTERRMYLWWSLCTLYLHACQASYHRRLRSLLLCLCYIFWALINSLVCWSHTEQRLFDMDNQVLQTKLLEPNSHRTVTLHCGQPCFTYTTGAKLTQNRDSIYIFTMDYYVSHTTPLEPNSHKTMTLHCGQPCFAYTSGAKLTPHCGQPCFTYTSGAKLTLHQGQPCFTYTSGAKLTLHQGQPCFTYNTIGAKLRTVSENRQTRERNVSCN